MDVLGTTALEDLPHYFTELGGDEGHHTRGASYETHSPGSRTRSVHTSME